MQAPEIPMNRRHFLTASGAIGLLSATGSNVDAQESASERQYLVLQKYSFEKDEQRAVFDEFMKELAIPALNRLGVRPVGVFHDPQGARPTYVLLPHANAQSALNLTQRLLTDSVLAEKGSAVLDAPKSAAVFKDVESWLLHAFKSMPKVELPAKGPERLFQLRIYESPSLKTGQKKIEMFNDAGEIKIFREVGLAPVFFGETIFGGRIPNLTYMLGFENELQQKEAWKKFGGHPEWRRISKMPEFIDSRIIRGITNILLKPAPYSQI